MSIPPLHTVDDEKFKLIGALDQMMYLYQQALSASEQYHVNVLSWLWEGAMRMREQLQSLLRRLPPPVATPSSE